MRICHTVRAGKAHRQGPNLYGVYGRPAGTIASFPYSPALSRGGWIWNDATLDAWITDAQGTHPGTSMNYRQSDPEKRAIVIAFLKSAAAGGPEKP